MNKVITFEIATAEKGQKVALDAAIKFATEYPQYKLILITLESEKVTTQLPSNVEVRYGNRKPTYDMGLMDMARGNDITLNIAMDTVLSGESSAVVSPASSGPLTAGSVIKYKTINNSVKPAFSAMYSGFDGNLKVILDCGANMSFTPEVLNQYSIMGSIMYKSLIPNSNPRVGLINIGTEDSKGTELTQATHKLLKQNNKINYKGFVEGYDSFGPDIDITVSDAVTGNIMLKLSEGIFEGIINSLRNAKNTTKGKLGLLMLKSTFVNDIKKVLNTDMGGGAVVLGLNHLIIKAHGSSKEREFYNSLVVAKQLIENNLLENIKKELNNLNHEQH